MKIDELTVNPEIYWLSCLFKWNPIILEERNWLEMLYARRAHKLSALGQAAKSDDADEMSKLCTYLDALSTLIEAEEEESEDIPLR